MKRREFITLLGGVAGVAARGAGAAGDAGDWILSSLTQGFRSFRRCIRRGLSDMGYVEGVSIAIEYRWESYDPLPAMAADLVRHQVLIVATVRRRLRQRRDDNNSNVFVTGADPVDGFVRASAGRRKYHRHLDGQPAGEKRLN